MRHLMGLKDRRCTVREALLQRQRKHSWKMAPRRFVCSSVQDDSVFVIECADPFDRVNILTLN
jgi:hypothetical protein